MSVDMKNEEESGAEVVLTIVQSELGSDYENDNGPLEDPLSDQGAQNGERSEVLAPTDEPGGAEDARVKIEQNGWSQMEYYHQKKFKEETTIRARSLEELLSNKGPENGRSSEILRVSDEAELADNSTERSIQPSTSGSRFDEDEPVECKFCKCTLQEGKYPRVMYCGDCGWSSVEGWKLRRHAHNRHIYEQAFFYCQCCEFRMEQIPVWPGESTTDRPYECRECDYRARTSTALNYHLRAKHSDERPYKCPHCSYAGVQSSSLKSHMLTRHNTGEKNLLCPQCDFRANIPSVLKKHIERKHADAKTRRARKQLISDLERTMIPPQVVSSRQDAPYVPLMDSQNVPDIPQEQNDVADYLQMPSFGLFEAIYESQGLQYGHQYGRKLRSTDQGSDVIVIDD